MTRTLRWMASHVGLAWLLCFPLALFPIAWAFDRDPPFEVVSVEPAVGRPGGSVLLLATVKRDIKRGCSVKYTRHLWTPAGYRMDLEGLQEASADQIARMETRNPERLAVVIELPAWITPGTAQLVTHLNYRCNPLHILWPISVTTTLAFNVEPA